MRPRLHHIAYSIMIITAVVLLSGHVAHAQAGAIYSLFNLDIGGFFLAMLANLAYYALTISSWFLTVCGTLLNASINLTLHISQLLATIPAVYTTWALIRDISSMFFIFALLYAAITMILGIEKQGFGDLIKNIIIAGVLINFSFFFVSVLIDASNIVSLQIYRAIAPGKEYGADVNSLSSLTSQAFNDGGISNVFMQALQPQTIYENRGQLSGKDVSMQMLIGGVGGTVVMVIAALSFLAAALAFCIRTGMLLLLLAFSPLWMAGRAIPKIKSELADPWWKYLYSNLIFMPVYLLFLYVAMRMLLGDNPPDTSISHILNKTSGSTSNGVLGASYFGLILNYVLAILLINAPLVAAMKVGGSAVSIGKKYGNMISGAVGGMMRSGVQRTWTNTGGRAASLVAKSERLKNVASNWKVGELALKGVRGAASGYENKLSAQVKSRTEFGESLGYDQQQMNQAQTYLRGLNAQLAQAQATGAPTANLKTAIRNTKQAITDLENRRKSNYANRIDSRSLDTLYLKVARKDKIPAAKLQIPIIENQLAKYKDDLKETRADIKQLQQAITNNPAGTTGVAVPSIPVPPGSPPAVATLAQSAKLNQLLNDQVTHTNNINAQEALLDRLKTIN